MNENYSWFIPNTYKKKPHVRINSIEIYKTLSPQISQKIDQNLPIAEIIQWLIDKSKEAYYQQYNQNPKTGSLNNAIGRWNEFILITTLSKMSLEINQNKRFCLTIFSIPNSSPNNVL